MYSVYIYILYINPILSPALLPPHPPSDTIPPGARGTEARDHEEDDGQGPNEPRFPRLGPFLGIYHLVI